MSQAIQITGGAAHKNAKGWFKPCFPLKAKAHHFERLKGFDGVSKNGRVYLWASLCGVEATSSDRAPMFEAGSWDRCKRCEKKIAKGGAA